MLNIDPRFSKVMLTPGSKMLRAGGPPLYNRRARAEVTLTGELLNFEMAPEQGEYEFIRVLHETQTWVHVQGAWSDLGAWPVIAFVYALDAVQVTYEHPKIPLKITKIIAPAGATIKGFFVHILVANLADAPLETHVLVRARFTLGDPYQLLAKWSEGLHISNRMFCPYKGFFQALGKGREKGVLPAADIKHGWVSDDVFNLLIREGAGPIAENCMNGKGCENQGMFLQVPLSIAPAKEPGSADGAEALFLIGGSLHDEQSTEIAGLFASKFTQGELENYEQAVFEKALEYFLVETPDPELNRYLAASARTACQVYEVNGRDFCLPGHQYPRFYARDSHWAFRGLIAMGRFGELRKLIDCFFECQQANKSFPTSINLDGTPNQFTTGGADIDSTVLPVLSLVEYVRWTRDFKYFADKLETVESALKYLESRDIDGDSWLEQEGNQDWADDLLRRGKVTYSQALYYALVKLLAELLLEIKKQAPSEKITGLLQYCSEKSARLKETFDATFWIKDRQIYADHIMPDGAFVNKVNQDVCLALIFGLASPGNAELFLSQLKERCWTEWGPAKQEPYDNLRQPAGFYHNGAVWGWCAAFECYARFLYDPEKNNALWPVKKCQEYDFGKNPYGCYYGCPTEWYSSRDGRNNFFRYKTSKHFGTGAGAILWAVLYGLSGLNLAFDGTVTWHPNVPAEWRGKKIKVAATVAGKKIVRELG